MSTMFRRLILAAAATLAAGLALGQPQPAPSPKAPPAPAPTAAPVAEPPAEETGPTIPDGSPPIPADQAQPASPDKAVPENVPTDDPTGTTAPLPSMAPTPIQLSTLPPVLDHPGSMDDAVPDAKGVKRSIVMGGLDKITARTFTFEVPVGHSVKFKKLMITPRTCHVRPPEETPETSVFVEVAELPIDGGDTAQRIFSGWMFASSPGLNGLEHPVYDVWVVGCHIDDPANPGMTGMPIAAADTQAGDKPSVDESLKDDDAARE